MALQFEIDTRYRNFNTKNKLEPFSTNLNSVPDINLHNNNIDVALNFLENKKQSFVLLDKGLNDNEKSSIYIENGHLLGIGYISKEVTINEISDFKEYVTKYKSNNYIERLIFDYSKKHPNKIRYQKNEKLLSI